MLKCKIAKSNLLRVVSKMNHFQTVFSPKNKKNIGYNLLEHPQYFNTT